MSSYRIVFYLILFTCGESKLNDRSTLHDVWNDLVLQTTKMGKCQSCAPLRSFIENALTDYELRNMRIDIVKQTILKGLGLSRPPKNKLEKLPVHEIPLPVIDGSLIFNNEVKVNPKPQVTERIIVLASDVECNENIHLTLNVPPSLKGINIGQAILWLPISQQNLGNCRLTSKLCSNHTEFTNNTKNISAQQAPSIDGWSQTDITWTLSGWMKYGELCHDFDISCASTENLCKFNNKDEGSEKPFAVIDVLPDESIHVSRKKRNINCIKGSTECCRESLHVSFDDIGWGNWIIQPKGYDSYYCKGNCANAATISLAATPYHSVMRRLSHITTPFAKTKALEIIPCCTPTRLSPLQLIYIDSNDTLIQKTIPELIVDSCGCM